MAIERLLLLIADIGGYTRFMNLHRWSLSHAQNVVAELLDSLIEGSRGVFEVAKLEGDAVFLYARIPAGKEADLDKFARKVREMREGFQRRLQAITVNRLCTCDGCVQAEKLKLKFVSHVGEAAFQRIRRFVELAGVDVILVHRMLKNSVPVGEYVLMTDGIQTRLDPSLRALAKPLEEEFEGLGRHLTHYIDLNDMALLALPAIKPSLWQRVWRLVSMVVRSVPYMLLKKPCQGFRHLDEITGAASPAGPPVSQEALGEGVRQ